VAAFNSMMARNATEWIAGAERHVIEREIHRFGEPADPIMIMERWPFDHRTARRQDRGTHRVHGTSSNDRQHRQSRKQNPQLAGV
jgi:hypothetical protein